MNHQNHISSPRPEVSDSCLIQQVLAGDQRAFEALMLRYETGLLSFICSSLKTNRGDDQILDVMQYVFTQFYLSLPTLSMNTPLKPWLFKVAQNRCWDELRRRRRRPTTYFSELERETDEEYLSPLLLVQDRSLTPEAVAEQHDLRSWLYQAIATLPPKFRSVVFLRYTQDMSFHEIGLQLHMPEATAKTYFHRARPLLRNVLQILHQQAS